MCRLDATGSKVLTIVITSPSRDHQYHSYIITMTRLYGIYHWMRLLELTDLVIKAFISASLSK